MTVRPTQSTSPNRRDFLRNAALVSGAMAATGAHAAVAEGSIDAVPAPLASRMCS